MSVIEPKTAEEHTVLDLSEADLAAIARVAESARPHGFYNLSERGIAGKSHGAILSLPALRGRAALDFASVRDRQSGKPGRAAIDLLKAADRFLGLLPAAVDLVRRVREETIRECALIARTAVGDGASLQEAHIAVSIAEAIEKTQSGEAV